jgi:altronate dehydratase large subunit
MSENTFEGYLRPDGRVGVRNHVLLLGADRSANMLLSRVSSWVRGTRQYHNPGEFGRPGYDRAMLARFMAGLGANPNVAAVIVMGMGPNRGYPGIRPQEVAEAVAASGKPTELLTVESEHGTHRVIGKAVELARVMVRDASRMRRTTFGLDALTLGVKCGGSDPCSGIAGNYAIGYLFDKVVEAGGSAIFDETTEVIGAENIVAARFPNPTERARFLALVAEHEMRAKQTGEDIRTINPTPSNLSSGISTLEEKSLGAICKSGRQPIQGLLEYAQRPAGPGLWFMDGWPVNFSLLPGLAAAGACITIYQLGGNEIPAEDPPLPSISSPVVAPVFFTTGNPRTYQRASHNLDFSSGDVVLGTETLEDAGERLIQKILSVASGEYTKQETFRYEEDSELPFRGPLL